RGPGPRGYWEWMVSDRAAPWNGLRAAKPPPADPDMREVAPVSEPLILAIMRSTGPPGANCTTRNVTSMIPNSVGIMSRMRRAMYAVISSVRIRAGSTGAEFHGLLPIVPPGLRNAARVARICRRPREQVPIREPMRRLVPVRNPVSPGTDDAVERPAGAHHRGPRLGRDDPVDQSVDHRIGDAGQILRALDRRRRGGEIRAQRIAGRGREAEPSDRDVEIELVDAGAILHRVDQPQRGLDAEHAEILDERHVMRLEPGLVDEEFDRHLLTACVHALAALHRKAGLLQQLIGAAKQGSVLTGAVGDGRHERLAEDFLRQRVAERLEQGEFFGARFAGRHHVRILEHRMGALIGAVHDGLVSPFEIEGVDQRLAQAWILEFLAPRIDEPALCAGGRIVREYFALHASVPDRWEIVARRPDSRGEFLAEQIVLGGEALEGDVAVAVILESDHIEIVLAARDRKLGTPPVLDPLVFDEPPGLEAADPIRSGAKRHFETRLLEIVRSIIAAREDRQRGEE